MRRPRVSVITSVFGRMGEGQNVKSPKPKNGRRMLVVHDTPLVAEDLREMLMSAGIGHVELASALPDDTPARPFDACLLSVSAEGIGESRFFEKAAGIAAHIVLIVGFLSARPELPPQFSILFEPFREEDVLAALSAAVTPRGGTA